MHLHFNLFPNHINSIEESTFFGSDSYAYFFRQFLT